MTIPTFPVYLFDVDGTLVDSACDICGAIQDVLATTRRNDISDQFLRRYIGLHLIVERGVVSRDHEQLSRLSSDKSWHEAVHERMESVAREMFPAPVENVSEEAS